MVSVIINISRLINCIIPLLNGMIQLLNGIIRLINGIIRLLDGIIRSRGQLMVRGPAGVLGPQPLISRVRP